MEYIVYKRFRGNGIDGEFNLRYGTAVSEIEGFLLQQMAGGYALRHPKTDGSILGRIHQRARCGRKCLNAFIAGMKKTAAAKTLRMKNGRGRKTGIGKIG